MRNPRTSQDEAQGRNCRQLSSMAQALHRLSASTSRQAAVPQQQRVQAAGSVGLSGPALEDGRQPATYCCATTRTAGEGLKVHDLQG